MHEHHVHIIHCKSVAIVCWLDSGVSVLKACIVWPTCLNYCIHMHVYCTCICWVEHCFSPIWRWLIMWKLHTCTCTCKCKIVFSYWFSSVACPRQSQICSHRWSQGKGRILEARDGSTFQPLPPLTEAAVLHDEDWQPISTPFYIWVVVYMYMYINHWYTCITDDLHVFRG